MENSKINIEEIDRKNAIVDNAIKVLKTEFVGIHKQIDEIMDNVRTWYVYPELQSRPLVVNLFGMSGIGKTSLVKRISQLLDIEKDFVYFNFASISEQSSYEIESEIEEELSNEKSNRMFVYDEFQYAATINPKTMEEREGKSGLKPFWELLDSGILHKRGSFWNIRLPFKVIEYMTKISMKCQMEIEKGVWTNAEECLSYFKEYDIQKFSEVFNFKHDSRSKKNDRNSADEESGKEMPNIPKENYEEDDETTPFFIRELYLDKIIELNDLASGNISDRLEIYHRMEDMDYNQLLSFISEVYENARKGYDLKFNDSIIFVIGNLDEAYEMSFNTNPDMSPDQFRKITDEISIVDIKDALKSRFRNEQIARLGNIHVIYPSFSSQDFKDIIEMCLERFKDEAFKLTGYNLLFEDSIKRIIYDEGVYPTHGTRPIFSSVHEIVKSKFPLIVRTVCERGLKDKIDSIVYAFDDNENKVVVYFYRNGNRVDSIRFNIKLRLKKLRDSDENSEEQALCALHESGHFVMYAKLFGKMPEKLVSRTTDSKSGGFMMEDFDDSKKKVSKRDMLSEIKVLLGGYVAEKIAFGDEMTSGAENDLSRATMIASQIVRTYCMGNTSYVTSNTENTPKDPFGYLVREDNQNYINTEIKQIITDAEMEVYHTLMNAEWKKMLKESALYLCEHSFMPKEKMMEIYDKVADSVKTTVRNDRYYHYCIETL